MKYRLSSRALILFLLFIHAPLVVADSTSKLILSGEFGSTSRWGSGWLDLSAATDFVAGDTLQIRIGGTASKVVVRLLPSGRSPNTAAGVVGGPIVVPSDRVITVRLKTARKGIVQISVHGGPNPWDTYDLGRENGPATVKEVSLIRADSGS